MNSLLPNVGYLRKHPYRTCTPSFRKYTHLTSKSQERTPQILRSSRRSVRIMLSERAFASVKATRSKCLALISNTAVTLVSNIFATFAVRIAFSKSKSRIDIPMSTVFWKTLFSFLQKSRGLTHGRVGPLLVISYELALLELRTCLLELLAMLVGGKLLEVLDKALCQILSLRLPLSGISIGVSWIEDSGVYAW